MSIAAQLGYLGLEVSDLGAWSRFATGVLGLGIGAHRPGGALPMRMDGHEHRFLLHEGSADDVAYIGWEVADRAALEAICGRLDRARVPFRSGSPAEAAERGAQQLISFEDPNGIRIEMVHGPAMAGNEFRSDKFPAGFRTGDQGMGHVLVNARDSGKTERFYREVLGFALSDYVDAEVMGHPLHAVFLHVNPRHHSLAFAELSLPKRLHHVMLEANSVDDVGAAFDRCQDLRVPLQRGLGRHQNDRMLSFYGYTPSGFCFEIGWGGRAIDDRAWEVRTYPGASEWGHRPLAPA